MSATIDPGEPVRYREVGSGPMGSTPLGQPTSQTYDGPIPAGAMAPDGTRDGIGTSRFWAPVQDSTGSRSA
jgi:hypothetical protein